MTIVRTGQHGDLGECGQGDQGVGQYRVEGQNDLCQEEG